MFPSDVHAAGPWTTFWGARHCRILKWSLDKVPAALKLVRWGSGRVHLSADSLPSATSLFLGFATSSQDSSVPCTSPSFKISAFYMGFNAALFSWTCEGMMTANYYDYLLGMVSSKTCYLPHHCCHLFEHHSAWCLPEPNGPYQSALAYMLISTHVLYLASCLTFLSFSFLICKMGPTMPASEDCWKGLVEIMFKKHLAQCLAQNQHSGSDTVSCIH